MTTLFFCRRVLLASVALVVTLACLCPAVARADDAVLGANPQVTVAEDTTSALLDEGDFGISKFTRLNKGTNKLYSAVYYGYRYMQASRQSFSMIVCDTSQAIVYVNASLLDTLGADIEDAAFQAEFLTTLRAIDAAASKGGTTLETLEAGGLRYAFTSDTTYVRGEYTYRFDVEVEEGYYYTAVELAGSDDGSGGALFCDTGTLTKAADTTVTAAPTGIAALGRFLSTLDYSPLWVSLKTTGVAIIFIFILGILAGWLTIRMSDRAKGVFDTIFTIPMVLPPTVCGFLLLMLFGQSTKVGQMLIDHGIDIVFTWPAAVIACIVVGFPLMYRTARGAFEALDSTMLDAARTLGWSELRIFMKLMLPLAWPSVAAGTVLAFARAMGEFGATLFFAGNTAGITQTIPIAIYFQWMAGSTDVAIFWVIVVILVSFLVILFINVYSSHTQKYRLGGSEKRKKRSSSQGDAYADERVLSEYGGEEA